MIDPSDPVLAYQSLQPGDILTAVESLGFRCDGRLLALNSYENRVYQVGIEGESPVVVKFYRPGRWSDAAIHEEHSFTLELAEQEIPVVAPLASNGTTLHTSGLFRFSVSPCHGGRAPELDDTKLQQQLGRLVARIHRCGELTSFAERPTLDIDSFGYAPHAYLLDNGYIPEELEAAYDSIADHLFTNIEACFERAAPTRLLRIHGDFHPGNVLVQEQQLHIVDFDDTRMGPAVQDIWMFLSGDRNEQTPQLEKLLEGYEEFRHFDARELYLVEALRTLRIIHYAAWLARRHEDPAFQVAFPWFNTRRYWDEHVLSLREQAALMEEPPLSWISF